MARLTLQALASSLASLAACPALAAFDFLITPPTIFPNAHFPTHLAIADLDGDGDLDFVVPGRDPDGLAYIMWSTGGTSFAPPTTIPVGGQTDWAEVVDLNNDGILDIVLAVRSVPSGISVVRGLGGGAFAPPELTPLGREIRALSPLDIDQDGDVDLAAVDYQESRLHIFDNDGAGGFKISQSLRLNEEIGGLVFPQHVVGGDIDNDGDKDLVVTAIGAGRVDVLRNRGEGTFDPEIAYRPPVTAEIQPAVTNSALGDIDQDGDLDIVSPWIMGFGLQRVGFLLNRLSEGQPGQFGPNVSVEASPSGISWTPAVGDLDGDGDLDLAVGYGLPGPIVLLENITPGPGSMPAFAAPQTVLVGQFVRFIAILDLDGDGDRDIALVESPGSAVWVLVNQSISGGVAEGGLAGAAGAAKSVDPPDASPSLPQPRTFDRTGDGVFDTRDLAAAIADVGAKAMKTEATVAPTAANTRKTGGAR